MGVVGNKVLDELLIGVLVVGLGFMFIVWMLVLFVYLLKV